METVIICLAAGLASMLTLFSGFGLGTLLMPVIALFFPLQLAIAMTAIVHFANNLFKLGLMGRLANGRALFRFGVPAVLLAFVGASLLVQLGDIQPLLVYESFGRELAVSPMKLVIGFLIIVSVLLELSPSLAKMQIDPKWLPLGGAISGFFGGLSGHQGAFRSLFLIKAGLDKDAFVATGIVLAVMVDTARMLIYGLDMLAAESAVRWSTVALASVSAFLGAFAGRLLLRKVTIEFVQRAVSGLLILIGVGLISGWL